MLSDLFIYDETSPSALRWREDHHCGRGRKHIVAGQVAGSLMPSGYWQVWFNNRNHLGHRVVVALTDDIDVGRWHIDHKDGNRARNVRDNLRLVAPQINSKNRAIGTNNTSGVMGVYLQTSGNYTYWVACCERERAFFSVHRLGDDLAFQLATDKRNEMVKQLAGYSSRHGSNK